MMETNWKARALAAELRIKILESALRDAGLLEESLVADTYPRTTLKTTDLMTREVTNDVWLRGCEYVCEHYVNNGVVVYCFDKNGRLLWDGCVQWSEGDRIIDVIRAARYSWELKFPVV